MALLFYIAAWTLAMGILEIVIAIRLRKEIEGEFYLFLAGLVSVIFAVLLMLFPGSGILGFVWVLATHAIVFGILLIILALGLLAQVRRAKTRPAKMSRKKAPRSA